MIEIKQKDNCSGCSSCYNICPQKCISMKSDFEGFLYPVVDKEKCINCGLCEKVCQYRVGLDRKIINNNDTYAAKSMDSEVLKKSSSGGIFFEIAKFFLEEFGIVFGVTMSQNFHYAYHKSVTSIGELNEILGSKYLQSNINDTYKEVKTLLLEKKQVLFSGTPCQIVGLKLFLNKEYENLYCIELICHGVPSAKLWDYYLKIIEQNNNTSITNVNFRNKDKGWTRFGVMIEGKNFYQLKSTIDDPYMQMFLRNNCLRPSCYNCISKKSESMADLTIADFWGIDKVNKEFFDENGVSMVIIQSEKGKVLFDKVKKNIHYISVDFQKSIQYNMVYRNSVKKTAKRKSFYYDLDVMNFNELTNKYCSDTFVDKLKKTIFFRIIYKLKKILKL